MRSKTYMSKINLQHGKLTVENRKSREKKRICSEVSVNSPGNPLEQQSPGRFDHPAWCVLWTVSQPRNAAEHRFVNIVSFWNDLFEINGKGY